MYNTMILQAISSFAGGNIGQFARQAGMMPDVATEADLAERRRTGHISALRFSIPRAA